MAYVTQQALGGHSIPINQGLLESMRIVGVVIRRRGGQGRRAGLERTVPKSKGAEVGSQLHQLGVEMHRSPYGPTIRKLLLEIEPDAQGQPAEAAQAKAEEAAAAAPRSRAAAPAPAPAAKAGRAAGKKTPTKKPAASRRRRQAAAGEEAGEEGRSRRRSSPAPRRRPRRRRRRPSG